MSEGNLPKTTTKPQRFATWWRRAAFILGILVFLLLAPAIVYQWVYSQRIFPGVRVESIDIGALRLEEAEQLIALRCREYSAQTNLAIRIEGKTWRFTPQQLGASYDIAETLANAYSVGRRGSPFQRLSEQAAALTRGIVRPLALDINEGKQKALLADLTSRVSQPMKNAGLKIESLRVVTTPAAPGRELDQEKTAALLAGRFASLSSEPLELALEATSPAILESDLAAAKAKAELMLSGPLTLKYTEHNWTWHDGPIAQTKQRSWQLDQAAIADMISFKEAIGQDGRSLVTVVIDKERAAAYGAKLALQVEQEPRDARFHWEDGRLTPIIASQEGRKLDVDTFLARFEAAVASAANRTVELPIVVSKPGVAMEEIQEMGIKDKIEERSTIYTYAGDSFLERADNIRLAAKKLNGVVVPPGEVFSFNEAIGEVSEEAGYKIGFAIIDGNTVPDVGGGVCQASTTVFQTVFWAGYPIVERHPHAYRMRRYEPPPGLDATVYPPTVDLKFKNNTAASLLIQARTDDTRLYVSLYGTKPSWSVRIEEPVLTNVVPADPTVITEYSRELAKGRQIWVERAEDGVDIAITRVISQEGKEISRDRFFSSYTPQRNVLVIGTGE